MTTNVEPPADAVYLALRPDGTVTWHGEREEAAVEGLVGGAKPGALTRSSLGPSCPLKVMASDVAWLYPADFEANPLAERLIVGLSGSYISQSWRGCVALYAHDDGFATTMPPEWVRRVTELVAGPEPRP